MPPVSTLTAMPHPGSQHLLDTALGTVTPAVPQQQPQCALHVPEAQDVESWKFASLQNPVSGPGLEALLERQRERGQGHGHFTVWGQRTEGADSPLKQVSVSALGVQTPEVQGRMATWVPLVLSVPAYWERHQAVGFSLGPLQQEPWLLFH